MSRIAAADPRGRLDVLAYRLAERAAERHCPQAWPTVAPHVARACAQLRPYNRAALGVLPLVPAAIALAAGAGAVGAWLGWDQWKKAQEYEQWKQQVKPPKPPPAPSAPQTKEELRNWTPELQLLRDREAWRKWAVNPFPELPNPKNSETPWLWIGAGALVLFLLLKR
ncbi:MAG: hypothetical protein KatS3mg005_4160 [Bryobacteraceae bacterium]|nr:MAG: hypothetical protein KatS3mg005_4160 [Bryobacteraceae bacterium]